MRQLEHLADGTTVVLGLPRGGVPVAFEVAKGLDVPLDVILVRKLGVPWQPELAFGAIGEDGARVLNDDVIASTRVSDEEMAHVEGRERAELGRRVRAYRGGTIPLDLAGRVVVVIDDGIATGATARAACAVARARGAFRVVLATPVAPAGWESEFAGVADEMVCLYAPVHFGGVGQFYEDFSQVSDEEVLGLLGEARSLSAPRPREEHVAIEVEHGVHLQGILQIPEHPRGCVVFVHGSGSSRHSPRNRQVATMLVNAGFSTLLFDLLTRNEERERRNVFDIELLASRLVKVTDWVQGREDLRHQPIGLFGASTGAAGALELAAREPSRIAAVVSRGGRPDLAGDSLEKVTCPVLLIVGALDEHVLSLNEHAGRRLGAHGRIVVIPGASHLFEEPGTLRMAGAEATAFFLEHLAAVAVG